MPRTRAARHVHAAARYGRRILHFRERKSGILRSRPALHSDVEGKDRFIFFYLVYLLIKWAIPGLQGFEPHDLWNESPPLTTRPGLPPKARF